MIEIKVSQGAKPGPRRHPPGREGDRGDRRGAAACEVGKTVFSPTYHTSFSTPLEMMRVHQPSCASSRGGKPVGFKICIGEPREFMSIVKAMIETGVYADFIVVDGGEGGTGAAPQEFSNSMGFPLLEGLAFVHNTLVGAGIRDQIKVGASGKMVTGVGDRDRAGARRGLVQLGARVHVLGRLHPGPALQHERVPGRRDDAEPQAPARAGRPRQGRARPQLPQEHGPRAGGVRRRDGPRPPEPAGGRITSSGASTPTQVASLDEIYPFLKPGQLLDGTAPGAHAALLERVDVRAVPVRPRAASTNETAPLRSGQEFTDDRRSATVIDLATYELQGDKKNSEFFNEYLRRSTSAARSPGSAQIVDQMAACVVQVAHGDAHQLPGRAGRDGAVPARRRRGSPTPTACTS